MNENGPLSDSKPYLSEVLAVDRLKKGCVNIIVAPCHSGKTTATSKIIEAHAKCPEHVLYLIDTSAGKSSIIAHHEAQRYRFMWLRDIRHEWWGEIKDGDGFRVMTYHQFGNEVTWNGPDMFSDLDLIICDEMHNLVKYIGIEYGKNLKNNLLGTPDEITTCCDAWEALCALASTAECAPLVVALTATPKHLWKKFNDAHVPYRTLDYTGIVRCDTTAQTHYYTELNDVFNQLAPDEKVLIYLSRIDMIKDYASKLVAMGRRVGCIWSIHNEKHPMNEQQLTIRNLILKDERIPDEIDTLFINAAYETSINIHNEDFNTMIVHISNPDTQTQVRGRLRHNIHTLYLYDKEHLHIAQYFPAAYLNRYLVKDDTDAIADFMNLDNGNGRKMKWPSIAKVLEKDGLSVWHGKYRGQRCWRVCPTSLTPTEQEVSV